MLGCCRGCNTRQRAAVAEGAMMTALAPRLVRETFKTSRLAEFASEKELVAQTGTPVESWLAYILKELIDNGIDIAEENGVAPVISVEMSTERGEIVVRDNGAGIAPEVVDSIIDYTARTSSRAGYTSPSRGQQGNALQTIIAMPFALDPGIGVTALIEAHGVAHRIRFAIDPVRQTPRISCDRGPSSVKTGTRITVRWPATACRMLEAAEARFLPLVWYYAALNPHLAITFDRDGDRRLSWNEPTNPEWRKWTPSDPIPAHWYTPETTPSWSACTSRRR
jgi:DNA topoisomerase VI subunit B